jgi:XTP/dITP diphosphohydrolase
LLKLIVATTNEHKVAEFRQILNGTDIELLSLKDINLNVDVVEDGKTFKENAYIKAKTIYELCKMPTIADDSGLEIEALDNFPGIYSARFEQGLPYKEKNKKILEMMKDKINRNACFKCALCVMGLGKEPLFFEGVFKGVIAYAVEGEHGFGYDPIFYYPPLKMTSASMGDELKNKYSHRGLALEQFKEYLAKHKEVIKND